VLDVSSRALNGILTGAGVLIISFHGKLLYLTCPHLGAIVGAIVLGFILDVRGLGRRSRGWLGLGVTTVAIISVWSCGLAYQVKFTRATGPNPKINFHDSGLFSKPAALMFFCEWRRLFFNCFELALT
jgi:hypothetical protein